MEICENCYYHYKNKCYNALSQDFTKIVCKKKCKFFKKDSK